MEWAFSKVNREHQDEENKKRNQGGEADVDELMMA